MNEESGKDVEEGKEWREEGKEIDGRLGMENGIFEKFLESSEEFFEEKIKK